MEALKSMKNRYRKSILKHEAGEAEWGFFMIIVIVCGVVSGALWVLNWVKETKDARLHGDRRIAKKVAPEDRRPPGTYVVNCTRSTFQIISEKANCSIDPVSYDTEYGDYYEDEYYE